MSKKNIIDGLKYAMQGYETRLASNPDYIQLCALQEALQREIGGKPKGNSAGRVNLTEEKCLIVIHAAEKGIRMRDIKAEIGEEYYSAAESVYRRMKKRDLETPVKSTGPDTVEKEPIEEVEAAENKAAPVGPAKVEKPLNQICNSCGQPSKRKKCGSCQSKLASEARMAKKASQGSPEQKTLPPEPKAELADTRIPATEKNQGLLTDEQCRRILKYKRENTLNFNDICMMLGLNVERLREAARAIYHGAAA